MSERLASIIDLYNTNEDIEANRIRDMLTIDERIVILKDKNLINSFNEKVYGNLFTIKEADELFEIENELDDECQKCNLYSCLSDQKFIKNFEFILNLKDKRNIIKMIGFLSSDYSKADCLQKIKVIPGIEYLFKDKEFIKKIVSIIKDFSDDRIKNICLGEYKEILSDNDVASIIGTLHSDKLKMKYLTDHEINLNDYDYYIISTLNSDKLKLKFINEQNDKVRIISYISKDSIKEDSLNKYFTQMSDNDRATIISTFSDDKEKERYMIFVHEKNNKYLVLKSFIDPLRVISWVKSYKNISDDMILGILNNVFDKDEYRLELFDLIGNQDMLIEAYQSLCTDTAKLKILGKLINKMYSFNKNNDDDSEISMLEKVNYLMKMEEEEEHSKIK